jgi:hypothetical protein
MDADPMDADNNSMPPTSSFLDARLCGIKLKVTPESAYIKSKELVVFVREVERKLVVCQLHYNAERHLDAKRLSLKHPSAARDNGLLVVIKGQHCGKLVRRISHRYESDNGRKRDIMLLAVVTQREGSADELTGEQLELDVEDLCLGSETLEEKRRNDNLMTAVRQQARKNKAK